MGEAELVVFDFGDVVREQPLLVTLFPYVDELVLEKHSPEVYVRVLHLVAV